LRFTPSPSVLRLLCTLLLVWTGGTVHAEAQPTPSRLGLSEDGRVGARVGASLGIGTLKGDLAAQTGGRFALELLPWLRTGGEGTVILRAPRISADDAGERSELTLGYGGVFLEVGRRNRSPPDPWAMGFLLGAGTARIRSPLQESELDTRNFFLVEPSVAREARVAGPARLEGRLAYRLPLDARPLLGVRADDLRGVSLRLTLSLVRSP
jgi:hypothetical protein